MLTWGALKKYRGTQAASQIISVRNSRDGVQASAIFKASQVTPTCGSG